MKSVLDKQVTFFEDFTGKGIKNISLLGWLSDPSFKSRQELVRQASQKSERDLLKKQLPVITPSGVFIARGNSALQEHSGLIQIDIDKKDNGHIENYKDLKSELAKIENIAYCGLSVSGEGYWALVPIAFPEKHTEHFEFLKMYFESKNLKIDASCKDVSRLRFYSYDPSAYFNHNAKPLKGIYTRPMPAPMQYVEGLFPTSNSPIEQRYNRSNHFEQILYDHGWCLDHIKDKKSRYTRPGKSKGTSADFHHDKRVFYVFTDGTEFVPNKGYTPFAVYAMLEHNGNLDRARTFLADRGFK